MTSLINPHTPFTFAWWIHEGGLAEEDGHRDAARAAYAQAADTAEDDYHRGLAETLRDGG